MKTNTTQKRHQIQVQTYSKEITFLYKDARVHYVVLKQQPHHTHPHHSTNQTPPKKMENTQSLPTSGSVMCRNSWTNQPPTPTHTKKRGTSEKGDFVVPGPNSVPNTTHPTNTTLDDLFPTPTKADVVLGSDCLVPAGTYFIDIPPLSNPPRNMRSRHESLLLTPPTNHPAVTVAAFGAP